MNRNVVGKIGEQQVKGKEGGRQKEIVHRMEFDPAKLREDEHNEEEEQQRDGSKIADFSRKRPGLQLFRHGQGDVVAGNQILVVPVKLPSASDGVLLCRRERVVGKVVTG